MRPSIDTVTAKILLAPVKYDFKRAAARCVCVTRGEEGRGRGVRLRNFAAVSQMDSNVCLIAKWMDGTFSVFD